MGARHADAASGGAATSERPASGTWPGLDRSRWADDLSLAMELSSAVAAMNANLAGTDLTVETKSRRSDLVTDADLAAERFIVDAIRGAHPDDTIDAEEGGRHHLGTADRRWLIDPLDGTNNFAIGLVSYGNSITLAVDDQVVVAVAHCALGDQLIVAADDLPTQVDGRPHRPSAQRAEAVSFIQSYRSIGTDRAGRLRTELERRFGRVLSTWSPITDLALLLSGGTAALVNFDPGGHDWAAVRFLAERAGLPARTISAVEGHDLVAAIEVIADPAGEASASITALLER